MRRAIFLFLIPLGALFFFGACSKPEPPADDSILRKPLEELSLEEMEGVGAMVETNFGIFHLRFFPRQAPTTVKNFIKLVQMGFYDGLSFHKVVPGYLIQGGDPKGDGSGGPGWTVPLELNSRPHVRGALGMVHPPFYPNDGGSQFYIMVTNDRKLDKSYAVFGEVWKGMETVDRIASLPLQTKGGQSGAPRNMALMLKVRIELIPAPAAR